MVRTYWRYRTALGSAVDDQVSAQSRSLAEAGQERRGTAPFGDLRREMERLLEEAGGWRRASHCSWERVWHPRCNVYECRGEVIVLVDLAGIRKEALDIRVDARSLLLRGERQTPVPGDAERCHHMEIPAGAFERGINLPAAVDPERVTVTYENGWLRISLPKPERMRVEIE